MSRKQQIVIALLVFFAFASPGATASEGETEDSEALSNEAGSNGQGQDDGASCDPTTWVQITPTFPYITIREDCIPIP